ncbi:hypothetical protein D3C71_512190 [compost metagenome]
MTKRAKIIYWVFTIWMSLGMMSSAIVQLIGMKEETEMIRNLGYPLYFMTLLGIWKILGVIVILAPKLPLLKEWAYAGFFFVMTGAAYSHIVSGDSFSDIFPSLLSLALTILSWYLRPPDRKIVSVS